MTQNIQTADTPTQLAQVVENLDGFQHTPQGVSVDFARFVAGRLHYVSEDRSWIAWNGNCWDVANAQTYAEHYWDAYVAERAARTRGLQGEALKSALHQVNALANVRARNETLALAAPKLAIGRDAFDRDAKHLLVTPSGTVNLKTGDLQANDPRQLLTQCTSVPYVEGAPPPVHFFTLVEKLSGADTETETWLWRALGYSITGDVREDAVFYLRGPGGNGKSTLIKTIFEILGSYAAKLNIRVLTAGSEYHDTEIAHIRGARFVQSSEIKKGMHLREDTLKDLSGGEFQTARDIQQRAGDARKWVPSCKIWLYGNHDLVIKDTSDSIWRRINKIESAHKFPQSGLRDSLVALEGVSILSLIVFASVEWHQRGLGPQPTRIKEATDAYRSQQDTVGQFFVECLVFERDAFTESTTLRSLYKTWASSRDYDHPVGPDEFAARLRGRGCKGPERVRRPDGTRPNGFHHVRPRRDDDPEA